MANSQISPNQVLHVSPQGYEIDPIISEFIGEVDDAEECPPNRYTQIGCFSSRAINSVYRNELLEILVFNAMSRLISTDEEYFDHFMLSFGIVVKRLSNSKIQILNSGGSSAFEYSVVEDEVRIITSESDNPTCDDRHREIFRHTSMVDMVYFEPDAWQEILTTYENINHLVSPDQDAYINRVRNRDQNVSISDLVVPEGGYPMAPTRSEYTYTSFKQLQFITKMVLSATLSRLIRHSSVNENENEYFRSLLFEQRTWHVFILGTKVLFLESDRTSVVEYAMDNGRSTHITDANEVQTISQAFDEKKNHQSFLLTQDNFSSVRRYSASSMNYALLEAKSDLMSKFLSILDERKPDFFTDSFLFVSKYEKIMSENLEGSIEWCRAYCSLNDDNETRSALDYILNICATAQINPSNWNFKIIFFNDELKIRGDYNKLNPLILKDRQPNEFLGVHHVEEGPKKVTAREIDKVMKTLNKALSKDEKYSSEKLKKLELEFSNAIIALDTVTPQIKDIRRHLGSYSEKAQALGIRKSCERLVKGGGFTFEGMDIEKDTAFVNFKNVYPFILNHKVDNKWLKIPIGLFNISINSSTFSVYMSSVDVNETPFSYYKHPYLPAKTTDRGHVLCVGKAHTMVKQYLLNDDYYSLLTLVRDLMNSYDNDNPYKRIEHFIDVQRYVDEFNLKIAHFKAGELSQIDFESWANTKNQRRFAEGFGNGFLYIDIENKKLLFNEQANQSLQKERDK